LNGFFIIKIRSTTAPAPVYVSRHIK